MIETLTANHALQRTRRERRGCNHCVSCAGSLSLGRSQHYADLKYTTMKHKPLITILSSLALCITHVLAQDAKPIQKAPKTKLEAFEAKTGTVLIKGIEDIGSVAGMGSASVGCREFTDANTGRKEYGITIEVKESGRFERKDTTLIDYDEIDSLLKGIDYIGKVNKSATPLTRFEAVYKTKGDLQVTTFSSSRSGEVQAAVQCGHIGLATAFLSLDQLAKFRALIQSAKEKLDSIKKEK
jgi:hypothetical protein